MRNRPLLLVLIALAALSAGYSGYWFWAADRMTRTVEGWIAGWRADGYAVDHDGITTGGFPSTVSVSLENPRLSDPVESWRWSGGGAELRAAPWQPLDYELWITGANSAAFPAAGRLVDIDFTAREMRGIASFGIDGRLRNAMIRIDRLDGRSPTFDADLQAGEVTVSLDQPADAPAAFTDEAAELEIIARDLDLPPRFAGPLGQDLDHFSGRFRLLGPIERTGLRQALEGWRDGGGSVEVPWFRVVWGPLHLKAEGTVALDHLLRPTAAFDTRIAGLTPTLERFADFGLIDRKVARFTGMGLQLFATRPGAGGQAELPAPVSVQDGSVFLGPLKVADAPPVLPAPPGTVSPRRNVPPDGATAPLPPPVEVLPALEEPPTVTWQ